MRKKPQLPNVSNSRGAPMGREEWKEDAEAPCRVFRLRFVDGAYDEGGAYWGSPANVYCCTDGAGFRLFCRAPSRKGAKSTFKIRSPAISFIN